MEACLKKKRKSLRNYSSRHIRRIVDDYESTIISSDSDTNSSNNSSSTLTVNNINRFSITNVTTKSKEFALINSTAGNNSNNDQLINEIDISLSPHHTLAESNDILSSDIPSGSTCSLSEESLNNISDYSNNSFSSYSEINEPNNFQTALCEWSIKNNISHLALSELLVLLKIHTNRELPNTARTILKTKRSASHDIINIGNGFYWHYGVEKCIKLIASDIIILNKKLVPTKWFTDDLKHSYWPPSSLNQIKVNKLIANKSDPDLENWSSYSVKRIFFSTVLNLILKNDYAMKIMLTLKIKKKLFKPLATNSILPEFPSTSKMKNDIYLSSNNDDNGIDIIKSPTTQIQHTRKHKSISPPSFNFLNDDKNDNSNEEWQKKISKQVSKCNLKVDEIYQQNSEIKTMFEEFKNSFGNIAAVNNVSGVANELLDLKLPFCDIKSLFDAEKSMKNDNVYYSQMVSLLKPIGGSNLLYIINNLLKKIMNNNLAVQFCFSGKNSKKYCFKNTLPSFLKGIMFIVRFHSPQTTIKEINDQIGKWLVQGKLRKTREDNKMNLISAQPSLIEKENDANNELNAYFLENSNDNSPEEIDELHKYLHSNGVLNEHDSFTSD
ncbi:hypothetical protein ACI65C_004810 [Semiaphis heraclei]